MKCRAITISNRHSNVRFFLLGTQYMYLKSQSFSRSIKKMLLHFHPASIVVQQQYLTATPTCVLSCWGKKNHQSAILYGKCLWEMLHFRRILNKISYISYNANVSYICHKHTCAFKISSQPVSHSVSFAVMLHFRRILNEI